LETYKWIKCNKKINELSALFQCIPNSNQCFKNRIRPIGWTKNQTYYQFPNLFLYIAILFRHPRIVVCVFLKSFLGSITIVIILLIFGLLVPYCYGSNVFLNWICAFVTWKHNRRRKSRIVAKKKGRRIKRWRVWS
jgi:hypothetical protein